MLDPFLTDNPAATIKSERLGSTISHILISHGHFDHVADAAAIANRITRTIVAIFEIAQWFANKQSVAIHDRHELGRRGRIAVRNRKNDSRAAQQFDLPDGSYGGDPAGFLLTMDGKRIYFACDTALFSDMRLLLTASTWRCCRLAICSRWESMTASQQPN